MICPRCFTEHNCTVCPRCGGFVTQPALQIPTQYNWLPPVQITEPAVHEFEILKCNASCCDGCPLATLIEDAGPFPPSRCVFGLSIADGNWATKPGPKCPGPGKYKIVRA